MFRHSLLGALLAAVLIAGNARGQSTPNWQTGYVPSAAEWNALWASKQDLLGFTPLNKAGDFMTGQLVLISGTGAKAPLRIPQGQAPNSPVNGDLWTTSTGLFVRINGTTVGPLGTGGGGVTSVFGRTGAVVAVSGDYSFSLISGIASSAQLPADVGYLDAPQSWTKAQRETPETVSISTSTFTPDFDAGQNFSLTLVHAACPCTLANPSTTPVAGQAGVFVIAQSSTGSDTIGTWGSDYVAPGGTSTITLSTGANAKDVLSYYVIDSTHIVLSAGALNVTH